MRVSEFLENVRRIADSRPSYRTGGDGSDGTCDCIGLVMGALGGRYDMHSTNYFARYQMRSLYGLNDEGQLHPGSIVYKSRRDTSQLNERYQPGGRYYTGDLLDYYHVGVVTSVEPLAITHCTSTDGVDGIAYDDNIRAWSWFGDLLDVEYDEEPDAPPATHELAVVWSEDGQPVRMRKTPTTEGAYNTIAKVPVSASVEVLESDGTWSKVRWSGQTGYMMNAFLRVIGMLPAVTEPETSVDMVTITISRSAAEELYKALGGAL